MTKSIKIRYFASFKDAAGKAEEEINTESSDARSLFTELNNQYSFNLAERYVKVAINGQYADLDTPLNGGEEIVFIPPVAGG